MVESRNSDNIQREEQYEPNNRPPESAGNMRSGKSRRGFAAMSPERQKEIARQGGKAAHKLGVAHQWNSQEAREAGRKGGQNSRGGGRSKNRNENIF